MLQAWAMASRAWLYPHTAERQYTALLRKLAADVAKETERQLRERQLLRLDSWSDDLDALFVYLAQFADALVSPVIFRMPSLFGVVNKHNDREWRLVVNAGTGIAIQSAMSVGNIPMPITDPRLITARFGMGVDVYRSEPWLAELQKNWISKNTSLIKSVPSQYMAKVEQIVRNGVMAGTTSREIAKQVKEVAAVTDRRAMIIARDQIGKANAELTQYRQEDLGVKDYTWRTAKDERVRGNPSGRYPGAVPSHYKREGKRYSWAKPPEGGHPGMAVLCRCFASPVFD